MHRIMSLNAFDREIIKRLGPDAKYHLENNTNSISQRIDMFNSALDEEFNFINEGRNVKNLQFAAEQKLYGNTLYNKKRYSDALLTYNKAILYCPQDTDESNELFVTLISNRSTVLYCNQYVRESLNDVNYLLTYHRSYCTKLLYKLLVRKAKCSHILQLKTTSQSYSDVIQYLQSTLNESNAKTVKKEIECIEKLSKDEPEFQIQAESCNEQVEKNHSNKSNLLKLDYTTDEGYFYRASSPIRVGDIVLEDEPFCSIVTSEYLLTNCNNCCRSIINFIPCRNCCKVIFCTSETCVLNKYHQYECSILPTLLNEKVSVNYFLALRLITNRPISFFLKNREKLQKYLKDDYIRKIDEIIKPNDYFAVLNLCRIQKFYMDAAFDDEDYCSPFTYILPLLFAKLLKMSNYYEGDESNENITLIASLISLHFTITVINSHEISEIQLLSDNEDKTDQIQDKSVGVGIYLKAARFNHSCYPNISRYNIQGNKKIVRAIRTINTNEIICDSYGCLFGGKSLLERQNYLLQRYHFKCGCDACIYNWKYDPQQKLDMKIKCQTPNCSYSYQVQNNPATENSDTDVIFSLWKKCPKCTKSINVFNSLHNISKTLCLMEDGDRLLNLEKMYQDAEKKYIEAATILCKYIKSPCNDLLKIQQNLRKLFALKGNRTITYTN